MIPCARYLLAFSRILLIKHSKNLAQVLSIRSSVENFPEGFIFMSLVSFASIHAADSMLMGGPASVKTLS